MSRFISKKTVKCEFESGEYAELRESLSYHELEPIMSQLDKKNEMANIKMAIPLLEISVVGWDFKDDDGNAVEFSKEKIKELDSKTVSELAEKAIELYFPKKKDLEQSKE